jgi:hypothetical protein
VIGRINKSCLRSIATPFGGSPMLSVAGARSTKFASFVSFYVLRRTHLGIVRFAPFEVYRIWLS